MNRLRMPPLARRPSAAATARWLAAGAFAALMVPAADAQAQAPAAGCEATAEIAFLPAPVAPWKGAPLHVMVAAEKLADGELSLIAPDGSVASKSRERRGGPPYYWFVEVPAPAVGKWRATLVREGVT